MSLLRKNPRMSLLCRWYWTHMSSLYSGPSNRPYRWKAELSGRGSAAVRITRVYVSERPYYTSQITSLLNRIVNTAQLIKCSALSVLWRTFVGFNQGKGRCVEVGTGPAGRITEVGAYRRIISVWLMAGYIHDYYCSRPYCGGNSLYRYVGCRCWVID